MKIMTILIFSVAVYIICLFWYGIALQKPEKKSLKYIRRVVTILAVCLAAAFDILFLQAKAHCMVRDYKTNEYEYTLKEMLYYNSQSVREDKYRENSDGTALYGQILIFVRYDCGDCVRLHAEIAAAQKAGALCFGSRTDAGHAVMEQYQVTLEEVPSAVYISTDGTVYVESMIDGFGTDMKWNQAGYDRLKKLQSMDSSQLAE